MSPTISATTQVLNLAELVREVLSHLGPADLARAMRVDSFWREEGQGQLYTSVQLSIPVERGVAVLDQVESFVLVVTRRAELAAKVDKITLRLGRDPARLSPNQSQLEASLFAACRNLTKLRLEGEAMATIHRFLQLAAAHSSDLVALHVSGPAEFQCIAPFLATFTRLTSLSLEECLLSAQHATRAWPAPTFRLLSTGIFIATSDRSGTGAAGDFDWFIRSSRGSLRSLTQGGCGRDALLALLDWGQNLEVVSVGSDSLEGDLGLIGRLAHLPKMRELGIMLVLQGRAHKQAVAKAARTANRQLGREVVVVASYGPGGPVIV